MAELPSIPNVTPEVRAPQPRVSPGQIEQPYNELAANLDKAGDIMMRDVATPLAQRAAAQDLLNQKITRGPDGKVQVENPASAPLIFGDAGQSYHKAVAAGTVAQLGNSLSQQMTEFHQKYPASPALFKTASDEFLDNFGTDLTPVVREAAMREGRQLQTQHFNSITDKAASIDVESQKQSIISQIDDQKNTAIALARQAGTDSPEFRQAVAKMNHSYDALGTNPLFKMSADQINLEKKNTVALLQGEALVNQVDATFNKRGKGEAQRELDNNVLKNPDLRETDRTRLYAQGMARLQFLTGDAKATVDANRIIVGEIEKSLANRKLLPTDPAIGMAIKRANDIGDFEGSQRLSAAAAVAQHINALSPLPDSVRDQVLGVSNVPYKTRVAQIEGGGTSQTGAEGKYQFLPSTWAQYGGGGNIRGDQEAAMDMFTAANQKALAQSLGRAPSPGELYLAHQQGAGGAAKLLANPLTRAGDLVGDKAIAVNGGDPNAPASSFTSMWINKFERGTPIQTGAVHAPSANDGPGFTDADVQRNPFLISAYVRSLASDPEGRVESAKNAAESASKSLANGLMPAPATIAQVRQATALYPEKMEKVSAELEGRLIGNQFASLPQEQHDAVMKAYRDASNGQDAYHQLVADAAFKQDAEQRKNMAEHSLQEAANRGWTDKPLPIDPANPNAIPPALVQRASLSARVGTLNHMPPPPLLDKDDMPKLQAALQGQNGAAILGSISQSLNGDGMQALLKEEGFRTSITGMSRSGDPAKMNAAYSFMDTLQKANPLQFDAQFKDGLKDLRTWQSNLAFYPPDQAAKRLMQAYDPNQQAGRQAADKVADVVLKAVTPDQVVSKFSTGWGPIGTGAVAPVSEMAGTAKGALKADYDKNYRDGFQATGDASSADAYAMEKMNLKYALSPTNGNRVTAYAPERYYPMVGGSHDWMAKQLDDDVAKQTGVTKFPPLTFTEQPVPPEQTPGERKYIAARALVPDTITERDVSANKPPSYQVIIQDPNGRWQAMPQRFRFDPTQPFAERATEMQARRAAIPEPFSGVQP